MVMVMSKSVIVVADQYKSSVLPVLVIEGRTMEQQHIQIPNVPGLFLPSHIQLRSRRSWSKFRHAIEIICILHGVGHHLDFMNPQHATSSLPKEPTVAQWKEWDREEALCKALIMLNVKDFLRYDIDPSVHTANEIWEILVMMHAKERRWWEDPFGWVRPLTTLEMVLVVLLLTLQRIEEAILRHTLPVWARTGWDIARGL
ncbi:hypothetical protein C8Q77DRAFT_1133966 [Trametes polyzona]|nr:hypothetical protein C8Q77DRAFT_1133966 [Trametes polyzona]